MEKVENQAAVDVRKNIESMQITLAKHKLKQIHEMMSKKLEAIRIFLSTIQEIDSLQSESVQLENERLCSFDEVCNEIKCLLDNKLDEIKSLLSPSPDFQTLINEHNLNQLVLNIQKTMDFLVPHRLLTEELSTTNDDDELIYDRLANVPF